MSKTEILALFFINSITWLSECPKEFIRLVEEAEVELYGLEHYDEIDRAQYGLWCDLGSPDIEYKTKE